MVEFFIKKFGVANVLGDPMEAEVFFWPTLSNTEAALSVKYKILAADSVGIAGQTKSRKDETEIVFIPWSSIASVKVKEAA